MIIGNTNPLVFGIFETNQLADPIGHPVKAKVTPKHDFSVEPAVFH